MALNYAEITTNQIDRMKVIFDSLKDVGLDGVMIFKRDSVQIIAIDMAQVIDVRFVMSVQKLKDTGGMYAWKTDMEEIQVGMLSKTIAGIIKRATLDDTLKLAVFHGSDNDIKISCTSKNRVFSSDVRGVMITDSARPMGCIKPGFFKYICAVHMQSQMFDRIVGDLSTSNPSNVEISYDGESIKLAAQGQFSSGVVVLKNGNSRVEETEHYHIDRNVEGATMRATYSLDYLKRIANAKNMSCKLTMYLGVDVPIMFIYETPIGELTFIVAARAETDDEDAVNPPVEINSIETGGSFMENFDYCDMIG